MNKKGVKPSHINSQYLTPGSILVTKGLAQVGKQDPFQ